MNDANTSRSASLLVIDDDQETLRMLDQGLRKSGFQVTTASSGAQALERARNQKFDLALVDIRMPGMPGFEVARQLLADCGCFSLILSGLSAPEDVEAAMTHGALGYLVKPFDIPRLVPTINAAVLRARELGLLIHSHEHLQTALQEGRETSMAIGILMERLRLDRATAFARLRDLARSQRRKVAEVALEILAASELCNGLAPASNKADQRP